VVARVKPDYLRRAYKVQSWESPEAGGISNLSPAYLFMGLGILVSQAY
jgi:hypothetical protein